MAFIIINLLLYSSWYALLFRNRGSLLFADRLTGTFILGLTQIIATEMLLGVVFENLYPVPLFVLNMFISLGVLALSMRAGGCRGICAEFREEAVRFFRVIAGDRILLCIFSLFIIMICWLVFLGYLFPSYSWDALYYHLPIVGQIMQSGAIQENPTPSFIQQYINIFSKNINLFFLWNIIFLKSGTIVDLGQLFFTIAGVLSVYSMAVKLKIKERYAIYASLLFFFTPVLILQSTINYVDGAVSMLFIIAVNFLMYDGIDYCLTEDGSRPSAKDRRMPLLLAGLAAGILLGSKPTGPVFIIVITAAIAVQEAVKCFRLSDIEPGGKGNSLKDSFRTYALYFIVPVAVTGGYWYIRNWIFYGNPVYYMDVSVFGVEIFKGLKSGWVEPSPEIIDSLNYLTSLAYVWMERVEYYIYDSRLSGFGPVWFILFLPSAVFSIAYAAVKKKYGFLFAAAVLGITFLIHPRNWTTRYVIFIVGLGALSFGLVLDYFSKRDKILCIIALALAGFTFMTANSPCIMPGKVLEFLNLPPAERTLSRHKPFNIDTKVRNEYGYWIWIENNVKAGDTLAYTFEAFGLDTSRPFFTAALWNREFSNKVVYIKSDAYKEWLKDLENNSAVYILVKTNSVEDSWIEKERRLFYSLSWMGNMTEKFKVLYADDYYKILKFTEAQGGGKG